MQSYQILWADDEIELLKPHILFLEKKGYAITSVNNGADALEACEEGYFDLVFLDENMPGMSGLETLSQIKAVRPNVPVVMITKSEEEYIMEDAIGANIADYLIKPVNPNQILLSIKRILDKKRIFSEKTNQSYQQDFRNITMAMMQGDMPFEEWVDVYKKLTHWELEIENTETKSMKEVLEMQKDEVNTNFTKYIRNNYDYWMNDADEDERPIMSHDLLRRCLLPILRENKTKKPVFFLVLDNLRYDQWKVIEAHIADYFNVVEEKIYCSILPTTTAYARNAIFSGMMPDQMAKKHSDIWLDDQDEGGKNNSEEEFLRRQMKTWRAEGNLRMTYHKILKNQQAKSLVDDFSNLLNYDLVALVFNFVDMLSHARTDTAFVRELAPDEAAYRSVTKSWFLHSPIWELIRLVSEQKAQLVITTDHGTIRAKKPYKIIGDRNTNTNLRYKQGRNLNYDPKNVVVASNPLDFKLPKNGVSSSFVFATEDYFFAYPNNYNYYVKYYKDTFQHGGVSIEEMLIPFVHLEPK
ncbi:MAG: bifunctional response regulator/alkaline phosphatase family protein [Bernardetiaceae bacterium]|nr:bifunctional response regulator/alkaline phosphatase family protein [Bernardetiaceae bacterium]